jgi:hypothetical protein
MPADGDMSQKHWTLSWSWKSLTNGALAVLKHLHRREADEGCANSTVEWETTSIMWPGSPPRRLLCPQSLASVVIVAMNKMLTVEMMKPLRTRASWSPFLQFVIKSTRCKDDSLTFQHFYFWVSKSEIQDDGLKSGWMRGKYWFHNYFISTYTKGWVIGVEIAGR